MTTSSGTGGPTARDGRAEVDRTEAVQPGAPVAPGNGAQSTTKASTAYEVAAALRAQASRAAQATRDAANRVHSAVTSPEQDVQAKAAMPDPTRPDGASAQPSSPGLADAGVTGAAAAVAATAPQRTREKPQQSTAAQPARQPSPQTAAQPAPLPTGQQSAPAGPQGASARPQAFERPRAGDPAAPPRHREQYDTRHRAQSAAPPVASPPVIPAPPAPLAEDDTQVSLDARPVTPQAPPVAPRPPQRSTAPVRRTTRVRKARLRLMRLDPWSVMKTAFLLSVALGISLFVAVAVLWSVLDAAGVFTAVGDLVRDLTQSDTSGGVDIENYTALSRVLGFTTLIAVVDVVLVTALATLGAFLYNLSASLLGGLEVTLAEDD